ncbi:MAG: glycosyltransferase [Bacteroidales bacterium]|nr:glycosyltransferase [Bacteroidales bacterium]
MTDLEVIVCLILFIILAGYGFIILYFTTGLFKLDHASKTTAKNPSQEFKTLVTIIVPVRNEVKHIFRILEEFRLQDYPSELFEVIVTDDFSEDNTLAFIKRFVDLFPEFPLKLITGKSLESLEYGKKSAIERAQREAKGELIVCSDADTIRQSQWISSIVREYEQSKSQMILAPVSFRDEKSVFQKIQSLEFMGIMAVTAGSAAIGKPVMANGANLSYTKKSFQEIGGFKDNLQYASGDDQFLMSSISKKFGRSAIGFLYQRQAIVQTWPEDSLKSFFQQRIRWISKGKGYRDPLIIGVAMVTYMVHFSLLAGMVFGFFSSSLFFISFFLWIGKILIDYPGVYIMARFFNKKEMLGYYFIAQVFQLFYVVFIGALGLVLPYRWKGRERNASARVRSSG